MARETRSAHVGANLFPQDKAEFMANLEKGEGQSEKIEELILEFNRKMRRRKKAS